MSLSLSLFLVALFAKCEGQEVTTLRIIPERNVSYEQEGSNVTIVCLVENLAGKTIQWSHESKLVAIFANENGVIFQDPSYKEKYSLSGAERNAGNFTFTIHDFSAEDVGEVTCGVNQAVPARKQIYLFHAPDDVQLSFVSNSSVHENNSPGLSTLHVSEDEWVNLTCSAFNSRPSALITWYWNVTNLFLDWNLIATTVITESNEMYNTSSILSLPPKSILTLYEEPIQEKSSATEEMLPQTASEVPTTMRPTTKPITSETSDETELLDESKLTTQEVELATIDHWVKVTCQADFENKVVSRSLLVHVGPYISSGGESVSSRIELHGYFYIVLPVIFYL